MMRLNVGAWRRNMGMVEDIEPRRRVEFGGMRLDDWGGEIRVVFGEDVGFWKNTVVGDVWTSCFRMGELISDIKFSMSG